MGWVDGEWDGWMVRGWVDGEWDGWMVRGWVDGVVVLNHLWIEKYPA